MSWATTGPKYRIREVDGADHSLEIAALHDACFGDLAPAVSDADLEQGHWWLAWCEKEPVGFAGLKQSTQFENAGYLCRVGVLPWHRGQGLQKRLLRVREACARRVGWEWLITDTTDNLPSANSLIAAGFRLYKPARPWSFSTTLYWRKSIGDRRNRTRPRVAGGSPADAECGRAPEDPQHPLPGADAPGDRE